MNSIRMRALHMIFFLLGIIFSVALTSASMNNEKVKNIKPEVKVDTVYVTSKQHKGLYAFMRHMSKIESDGKAHVVNRFGMMGKYQFSPRTLRGIGFNVSREEFLANPELQDEAMIKLLQNNKKALRKEIKKFSGKYVNGVYVTESGILAGAHLVGVGGVLAFFYPEKYDHNTVDGNGTQIELYMKKFAGYNLKYI